MRISSIFGPVDDITKISFTADLKALKLFTTNFSRRRIKMIDSNNVGFETTEIVQIDLLSEKTIDYLTTVRE